MLRKNPWSRRRILGLGITLPLPFVLPLITSCGDDDKPKAVPTKAASGNTPPVVTTPDEAPTKAGSTPVASLNCVVTPQETEGPYFVDERLNRADVRSDPATGKIKGGLPLTLDLGVFKVDGQTCSPMQDAQVDIWQCDAEGAYSDVAQNNTTGQKFLRGYQLTGASGRVNFTTIYPGWYQGRTVHIHFKVRTGSGSSTAYEFTSQFYFDDALSDQVFANAPYNTRGRRTTRNANDGIFSGPSTDGLLAKNAGQATLLDCKPAAQGYTATFDIGVDTTKTTNDNGAPPR